MTRRIVSFAASAALRSPFRWRVGAVVYRGSKILGVGTNDMESTSPKSFHKFKSRHAEFNAIIGIRYEDLKGASIYVHRIGRDGIVRNAKPCEDCQRMIRSSGIRKVQWSNDPIYAGCGPDA